MEYLTGPLLAFLGISILVIVTPGPDTAVTIRNTLLGGRSAGIATAFGVSVLVMSHTDLDQMDRNIMDPQGRASTLSGQAQASIGTVPVSQSDRLSGK